MLTFTPDPSGSGPGTFGLDPDFLAKVLKSLAKLFKGRKVEKLLKRASLESLKPNPDVTLILQALSEAEENGVSVPAPLRTRLNRAIPPRPVAKKPAAKKAVKKAVAKKPIAKKAATRKAAEKV